MNIRIILEVVEDMEQFKFDSKNNETIVNAIVEGYREYIEHRKDRHQKMAIHANSSLKN